MNYYPSIIRLAFVTLVCMISFLTGLAQNNADEWLRVSTEEESTIDVNRLSLVVEQNQVISARFRTVLSTPEPAPGKSGVKYKTRLDSIQFSVKDRRYRIAESNLLDVSGRIVFSYPSSSANDWRPLWGRTGTRLFNAASQLRPFGIWKVINYRYASGDPASDDDPAELKSLVSADILFNLDKVVVGKETCSDPMFDAKTVTNEEFGKRVGSSLESLGLPTEKVEAILLKCESKTSFPLQTFMLRLPGNKALMLWDGVFLQLERTTNPFR